MAALLLAWPIENKLVLILAPGRSRLSYSKYMICDDGVVSHSMQYNNVLYLFCRPYLSFISSE